MAQHGRTGDAESRRENHGAQGDGAAAGTRGDDAAAGALGDGSAAGARGPRGRRAAALGSAETRGSGQRGRGQRAAGGGSRKFNFF
ncbi:hypothetical protein KFK09_023854 [Dendrobium nobile]|uniref:Uncharacterized protein n=1 Tax=Dendrobium nobile TaxID=94219 RepID=A0A8T3AC40_DENNO|nr:hypothetical protein KFK09_023854 [Dendrobium nobile]